jgi:threonine dehydrogenase-like Zn-dependent dehydrogenase
MKALQLESIGKVRLVDVPIPTPALDEILVKTGTATICTSDLNDIRENPFGIPLPIIFGHEAAGTVAVVGAGVTGFAPGDRVATHPVHPCGTCPNCLAGYSHLCLEMGHFGINRQGTFSEYYPVRADRARLIPAHVSFNTAALVEPVAVCLEALAQAKLPPGGSLLIIGDGPFGVLMARLAQRFSPGKVVLSGQNDFRLMHAPGVVRVNETQFDDPTTRLRAETGPAGYEAVILAVGSARAVRQGLNLLRAKGRFVVFSALSGETPINLFDVHLRELEIAGACGDESRFDEAVNLLSDPRLRLDELVTHTFPVDEYQQAFDLAENGHDRSLKVAITFERGAA